MAAPPDLVDIDYIVTLYPEAEDSALVAALIAPISAAVKKFCHRDFYETEYIEYLDVSSGQDQLYLKQYPLISIEEVNNDADWLYAASTEVDSDDYAMIEDEGIIQLKTGISLSAGRRAVKVEYTAGYGDAIEDLPEDLKEAVARWIVISSKMWSADQLGVKSLSQGDVRVVYDKGEPPMDVRPTLVRYRRVQA